MSNEDKTRKLSKSFRDKLINPEELEKDLAQWEEDIKNSKEHSYNELLDEIKGLIKGVGDLKEFMEDAEDMEDLDMFCNDEFTNNEPTPLHKAIEEGKNEIKELLINAGAKQ